MSSAVVNGIDLARLPRPHLPDHPEYVALYDLAWRLAARHIRTSRGRRHLDAAWSKEVNYQWVWDTCFMALYCRYAAGQYPGVQSLDNFYELQRDDGYIAMTYDLDTGVEPWPNRINPPLFAWVEYEHYRATGDASRLPRAIAHIEKLMAWIDANRRTAPHRRLAATDGPEAGRGESAHTYRLYYFADCGSSGMDDSPRTPRHAEAGRFFDWIDLSSQMALSFQCLAAMHRVLGQTERAAHWAERAATTGALINDELWCPRTRFYHDRSLPRNFVGHLTIAGFWPILAGICPPERLDDLCAHLRDERSFARPIPIPSLSAGDPNYCPRGTYWIGGVWAPTNYMVTRGLALAGRRELAHEIAQRYLAGLARTYAEHDPHTLWECNSPEEPRPGLTAYLHKYAKPDFVGWSGLGPIAMLIENLLGLELDAPARRVTWDIRLPGAHGIDALPVGEAQLAVSCQPRADGASPARIRLCASAPLTLAVLVGERCREFALAPGHEVTATV